MQHLRRHIGLQLSPASCTGCQVVSPNAVGLGAPPASTWGQETGSPETFPHASFAGHTSLAETVIDRPGKIIR